MTKEDIIKKLHVDLVEMGIGTNDPQVYWFMELLDLFLRSDREDFPPAFYDQITEEKYPHTLACAKFFVEEKREKGLSGFHATPGPKATMETFAQSLLESWNAVSIRMLDLDGGHPQIDTKVAADPEKRRQYNEATEQWKAWKKAEENRMWRNAYIAKGRPIPEEFGTVQTWDDIPIPPPPKVVIE